MARIDSLLGLICYYTGWTHAYSADKHDIFHRVCRRNVRTLATASEADLFVNVYIDERVNNTIALIINESIVYQAT